MYEIWLKNMFEIYNLTIVAELGRDLRNTNSSGDAHNDGPISDMVAIKCKYNRFPGDTVINFIESSCIFAEMED